MKRFLIDLILFLGVFLLPWWVVMPISFAMVFYFDVFLEGVLFGFLIDVLYRPNVTSLWSGIYILTTISLILFIIAPTIKRSLRLVKAF